MSPETVRNADLCALMDGECGPGARERIEAELALSPQCADRLALWRRNDAALRLALAGAPGPGAFRAPAAAPVIDGSLAMRPDASEPLADVHSGRSAHDRMMRNARAATIAAFAGGAGAGAIALAILLLAP